MELQKYQDKIKLCYYKNIIYPKLDRLSHPNKVASLKKKMMTTKLRTNLCALHSKINI